MTNLFQKKREAKRDPPLPTGIKTEEVGDERRSVISLTGLRTRASEKRSRAPEKTQRHVHASGFVTLRGKTEL